MVPPGFDAQRDEKGEHDMDSINGVRWLAVEVALRDEERRRKDGLGRPIRVRDLQDERRRNAGFGGLLTSSQFDEDRLFGDDDDRDDD